MKILLIRHGETDWNCEKKYYGATDTALNANGIKQAEKLSKRLKYENISRVCSSDLKRAEKFARLACNDIKVEVYTGLREINFGIFEGLTSKQINSKYKDIYQKWINDPFTTTIPEAESLDVFSKRVITAYEEIISVKEDISLCIFTHGGPLKVIMGYIMGLDRGAVWSLGQDIAALNIIKFDNDKFKVSLLNDTSYLEEWL
ncbi:MAG: histidine phosphatase family protein [bacterium]|nr:histidine phosphatase family protein [bacterium]